MKEVHIQIHQEAPGKSRNERELIKSVVVVVDSEKRLTASRASQILKRELPRFICASTVIVIKTE